MRKKYRKKPVEIFAILWDGKKESLDAITEMVKESGLKLPGGDVIALDASIQKLTIPTLENPIEAALGDFIIQGVQKECYPCKPDIFEKTYEAVG